MYQPYVVRTLRFHLAIPIDRHYTKPIKINCRKPTPTLASSGVPCQELINCQFDGCTHPIKHLVLWPVELDYIVSTVMFSTSNHCMLR